MNRLVIVWLALAALCLTVASGANASIILASSTFDVNAEGWTVSGDAQSGSVSPDYKASGGNPGGYVSAKDDVAGGVWYWNAPAKFLGNILTAYGESLEFDLTQSLTDSQFTSQDVILTGSSLTIYYNTAYHPNTTWTHYSVGLSEAGWRVLDSNVTVTQAQMQSVLSSVTSLRIRGEYRTGADTDGLDNAVLYAVPEPGSISALLSGIAACCVGIIRRRR